MRCNLKRISLLLCLSGLLSCVPVMAQNKIPVGRSRIVTMFEDFKPGVVVLDSGRRSRQSKLNIFMKKSTLLFKQGNSVMEAVMPTVKRVEIDNRVFVNHEDILAEVIVADSLHDLTLLRVRTVDVEAMEAEAKNNSTVSNMDFSSASNALSVMRRDDYIEEEPYLLVDEYFFLRKGKKIMADERSVKSAISKKRRPDFEKILFYDFSWSKESSLISLMPLFYEQ